MTLSWQRATLPSLGLLTVLATAAGLSFGAMRLPIEALWGAFATTEPHDAAQLVLWNLRLPRVLLGLVVGASLGVCGALMQGLFRNPLASPSLIGSSTGASMGAAIAIVLLPTVPGALSVAAVLGSLLATLVVLRLGTWNGVSDTASLLLAGIAVNAICGAGTGLMVYLSDEAQLRTFTFFTLGSLGGASWDHLFWVAPLALTPVFGAPWMIRPLDALLLGESEARHLGIEVERLKRVLVVLVSVGVGVCVAASGVIGFVGLAVPHLVRLAAGPRHANVLPGSALCGAALLVLADTAARTLVAPAELPIGILTTLIGGPFFLALLLRTRSLR